MEDLDLKELFLAFWNKKLMIVLIVIMFSIIGYIYSITMVKPVYTSFTTLVLAGTDETEGGAVITTTDITLNSKLISTYSELLKSNNVVREVKENLDIDVTESEIKNNIVISSKSGTDIIEIRVTNANPEYAAKIANETAEVFKVKVSEIYNINNIHVVDVAEESNSPSNINLIRDILMFMIIGGVIAVIYVIVANILDTTIKTEADIEKILEMPVLAVVPESITAVDKARGKGGRR